MTGVNKHILIGHVGRDPEIRTMQAGTKVATFSLATSSSWKDKTTGERKEATAWHNIVVFNERLVEIVDKYVKKGSKLYLEGEVLTRKYQSGGVEKSITETVLKSFGGRIELLDRAERAPTPGDENTYAQRSGDLRPPLDDEVPY